MGQVSSIDHDAGLDRCGCVQGQIGSCRQNLPGIGRFSRINRQDPPAGRTRCKKENRTPVRAQEPQVVQTAHGQSADFLDAHLDPERPDLGLWSLHRLLKSDERRRRSVRDRQIPVKYAERPVG